MTSYVAPEPGFAPHRAESAAQQAHDAEPDLAQRTIVQLRVRIEHLERVTLLGAKEVEALADEVERLTLENERLRQPRGLKASMQRAWHRLDG